ncbi:MAG: hypothetical protein EBR82_42980 [Caulobacteraceae bacterium]|nr:hypothetical protein [Caulobacteraceae bacterium]
MSVRDLEAEGVLPAQSKSMGTAEFSITMSIVSLQSDVRRLRDDLARCNEVIAGLAAKVRCLEVIDRQPLEIKGEWKTGGVDQ